MKTPFALVLTFAVSIGTGFAQTGTSEETAIRAVIQNFADSRNAHDGTAAAKLYTSDGRYIRADAITVKGTIPLRSYWSTQQGKADREIKSIEFVSSNIAVVRASVAFDFTLGTLTEAYVLVKNADKWEIQLHQAAVAKNRFGVEVLNNN